MWVYSRIGDFSIVQKKPTDTELTVRSYYKKSLDNLRELAPTLGPDLGMLTDYPHRAMLSRAEITRLFGEMAGTITYNNCKSEFGKTMGSSYTSVMFDIHHDASQLAKL